jgi:hypothetical protein
MNQTTALCAQNPVLAVIAGRTQRTTRCKRVNIHKVFEILVALSMKCTIVWDVRSCILVEDSEEHTATIFMMEEQSNNQR